MASLTCFLTTAPRWAIAPGLAGSRNKDRPSHAGGAMVMNLLRCEVPAAPDRGIEPCFCRPSVRRCGTVEEQLDISTHSLPRGSGRVIPRRKDGEVREKEEVTGADAWRARYCIPSTPLSAHHRYHTGRSARRQTLSDRPAHSGMGAPLPCASQREPRRSSPVVARQGRRSSASLRTTAPSPSQLRRRRASASRTSLPGSPRVPGRSRRALPRSRHQRPQPGRWAAARMHD